MAASPRRPPRRESGASAAETKTRPPVRPLSRNPLTLSVPGPAPVSNRRFGSCAILTFPGEARRIHVRTGGPVTGLLDRGIGPAPNSRAYFERAQTLHLDAEVGEGPRIFPVLTFVAGMVSPPGSEFVQPQDHLQLFADFVHTRTQ